jgi:O-antigen ligase
VFYGVFTFTPLKERFLEGDVRNVGGRVSINVSGRDLMWSLTWHSYLESPLYGKGIGSAERILFERSGGNLTHPHNEYLRILHDYGPLGLMFWVWGFVTLLRKTGRAWRKADQTQHPYASVHLAAVLSLAVVGIDMITSNPIVYVFVMGPVAIIVGTSLGLASSASTSQQPSTLVPPRFPVTKHVRD